MTSIPMLAESHQRSAAITAHCPNYYREALADYPENVSVPQWELYLLLSPIAISAVLLLFGKELYCMLLFFLGVPGGILFAKLRGDIRSRNRDLLNTLLKQVKKLEEWSGHSFSNWTLLNEDEVQRAMNQLMLVMVRPVYDLQEKSAGANPLEWREKHMELMQLVKERFDTLKHFGYMPWGGYGLFFQHVSYERANEPEKFILAV